MSGKNEIPLFRGKPKVDNRSFQPNDRVTLRPVASRAVLGHIHHGGEAKVVRTLDNGTHGLAVEVELLRNGALRFASPSQLVLHRPKAKEVRHAVPRR